MLPADAPKLSGKDFDPASMGEEDVDMDPEEDEGGSGVELSSVEINILVYLYLLESNFPHTAFTLLSESSLPSTTLFQHFHPSFPTSSSVSRPKANANGASSKNGETSPDTPIFGRLNGRIPRGELIRKLWKGLRWEEVERHVNKHGEPFKPQCPSPFHLLIPHVCPSSYPSSSQNPPLPLPSSMRISPPPQRSEAFPPPAETEAGPSRPRPSATERLGNGLSGKSKRRSRRNSTESENRQASPARSSATGTGQDKGDKDKAGKEQGRERTTDLDKERKRSRGNGESSEKGGLREMRDRLKGKEKDSADGDDRENTAVPKIRIGNGTKSRSVGLDDSREESPASLDKKRKRDKDKDSELRPPSSSDGKSDRRSKSPVPPQSGSTASSSRKSRDVSSDLKPKRGAGNPLCISDDAVSVFKDHRDSVLCLGWNPRNTSLLATGSMDGYVRLWEFESQPSSVDAAPAPLVLNGKSSIPVKHTSVESSLKKVHALSWHPEGSIVATASADGVGRLFTPSGQLQGIMSYGRRAMAAIKFSPDGRQVLAAKHDFTVNLWKVEKGYSQALAGSYDAHTKEVNDVDWLDNHVFATAGNDHTIFVFRTSDKDIRYTLKGHTDDVTRITWSPAPKTSGSDSTASATDTRLLASVSDDGYAMVWKLPQYPLDRARLNSRSASPTKQPSATASASTPGANANASGQGGIGVKEDEDYFEGQGRKGKEGIEYCVGRFCVVDGENTRLNTLEWSPTCRDGRMLLAAGAQDTTVKIFDVTSGQLLHELKGLESGTASLSFSPLGVPGFPAGAIVGGGWMGQLRIWDVETGEQRAEWEVENPDKKTNLGVLSMSWRNDGKQLALGMQNKLVITIATDLEGIARRSGAGGKAQK